MRPTLLSVQGAAPGRKPEYHVKAAHTIPLSLCGSTDIRQPDPCFFISRAILAHCSKNCKCFLLFSPILDEDGQVWYGNPICEVDTVKIYELNRQSVLDTLPERDPYGHKGTFGKVLLLCGSRGFTGAAYLAAMGALRAGAGLVYLGAPESIYAIEAVKLNEPVVFPLPEEDGKLSGQAIPEILKRLPAMDAVLLGCGLGVCAGTLAVVQAVLETAACPVVLDADGINVLSGHMDILRGRRYPTILTPHDGEFLRAGGVFGEDRMAAAAAFAAQYGCILLLKGHRTCITDGQTGYINRTGNPGMAVGGSGDVLAGILTGLLGQDIEPLKAAACAAWLHGAAGDLCADELGQYAMLPTDMLNFLPRLLK